MMKYMLVIVTAIIIIVVVRMMMEAELRHSPVRILLTPFHSPLLCSALIPPPSITIQLQLTERRLLS